MMDSRESLLAALRLLTDAVRKLRPDQVEQLVNGKAELAVLPPGAMVTFPGPDAGEVRARLASAESRRGATIYLTGLKLKKSDLMSLARQLDIAVTGKDTIAVIQNKIIDGTVGTREDAAAIRDRS